MELGGGKLGGEVGGDVGGEREVGGGRRRKGKLEEREKFLSSPLSLYCSLSMFVGSLLPIPSDQLRLGWALMGLSCPTTYHNLGGACCSVTYRKVEHLVLSLVT